MSYYSRYDKGDWKALCDVCGREFKASQLNKRWDGLMCCKQDWEPRQPQDFVRGVSDPQLVPWTRPEPTDSYLPITIGNWFSWLSGVKASISMYVHHILTPLTMSYLQRVNATVGLFIHLVHTNFFSTAVNITVSPTLTAIIYSLHNNYITMTATTTTATASITVAPIRPSLTLNKTLDGSAVNVKTLG